MECTCKSKVFFAHQVCHVEVVVDGDNNFIRHPSNDVASSIYDSGTPYGPYTCSQCGKEYDELTP